MIAGGGGIRQVSCSSVAVCWFMPGYNVTSNRGWILGNRCIGAVPVTIYLLLASSPLLPRVYGLTSCYLAAFTLTQPMAIRRDKIQQVFFHSTSGYL